MKSVQVDCGAGTAPIRVPDDAVVLEYDATREPATVDEQALVREALRQPLGLPTFDRLVSEGSRVAIGFDDLRRPSHVAQTVLPLILDALFAAGVRRDDVTLVCGSANHCRWTDAELAGHVGADVVPNRVLPHQVTCHDAADPNSLVYLGRTPQGAYVEVNRLIQDSDLFIYQGSLTATSFGGYAGLGIVMGLSSARGIRSVHGYDVMSHENATHGDHRQHGFRQRKQAIHDHVERATGRQVFYVDTLTGRGGRVLAAAAGHVSQVGPALWDAADCHLTKQAPQADVLVVGLPRTFMYQGSDNPLVALAGVARPARTWTGRELLREGGVCIGVGREMDGRIDPRLASYPEVLDRYATCGSVPELQRFEEEFLTRPDYLYRYQHCSTYHPVHPFWLFYEHEHLLRRAGRVIFTGVTGRGHGLLRGLGCATADTFDAAWKMAARLVGADPVVVVLPSYWTQPQFKMAVS